MRQERNRRALSSVEQEGGWPIQIGTRPSRFLKQLNRCGFAVVALQDSAELDSATNLAFGYWNKGVVQNSVVSTDTSMRALFVIMFQPHAENIVELPSTKADELIQDLALCTRDIALNECMRFRCLRRNTNTARVPISRRRLIRAVTFCREHG